MSKKGFLVLIFVFYLLPLTLFYLPDPYSWGIHNCHFLGNIVFLFTRYGFFIYLVLSIVGLIILLYKFFSLWLLNRKLKDYIFLNSKLTFLDGEYCYLLNIEIPLAFTFGYLNEKIVLTEGLLKSLNKEEIKAVLLHEKGHIAYKHNIKKLFYALFLSPFVFFRFFNKFYNFVVEYMEIEADRYALKTGISPSLLSTAILKVKGLNVNPNISYFGLIGRVETLFSKGDLKFSCRDLIKGSVCLVLPWILLIINLFSATNACIVNPDIMNKKNVKNKLICS